ncbi:MAG: S8 family serine peptidase [Anaerolineae bacterium]
MKIRRIQLKTLTAIVIAVAVLVLAMLPLAVGTAQPSKPAAPAMTASSSSDAVLAKIHPKLKAKLGIQNQAGRTLAAARPGAVSEVEILARVQAGTDISQYMTWSLTRPFVDPFGRQAVVGAMKATNVLKLASLPEVSVIQPLEPLVDAPAPPDPDVTSGGAAIQARKAAFKAALATSGGAEPTGWWDVGPGHHSSDAWDNGFTGQGVKVMVNDSSTDFAHPDLQGTWAVVTDPDSPYFGWPEMFDSRSMYLYVLDSFLGATFIADGQGDYADTSTVCAAGEACVYAPIDATEVHTYTLPATSVSGEYHIGSHPDKALADMVNGNWDGVADGEERVAILVVDENEASVYDTVYVDLNGNFDFTDDKPVTKDDPISWADVWDAFTEDPDTGEPGVPGSDGYADVSGGLVYFIADGVNPIPASDWMWGTDLAPAPDNGNLVAFVVQDYTESGGDHGQLTSSNVVGQGVIDGGAPPWKPAGDGTPFTGMVQAAGKDVKLTVNGNFYASFFVEDGFLFAALGYDGEAGTEDDIQVISNSWGSSATDNDGWDEESRLIDAIARLFNPMLSVVVATGNGAAAYGTVTSPNGPNIIGVGASTQYGSTGTFDSITETAQINWGDVMSWSNRGPGARGDNGVHVTANGAWGAGDLSLNDVGDGWTAWDSWGGTSRSCPVAAGNLALVYQAYKDANGEWPDYATARAILMAGADNQDYDTLVQGAGSVNAGRATAIAAGLGGVYFTPESWAAGDYRGTEYTGFASILHPGDSGTKTFTVSNVASNAAEITFSTDRLVKTGEYTFDFTSEDQSLEDGAFTKPDYIFWLTDQIPQGTDLIEVKAVFPWNEWDPDYTYEIQQQWRVHVQDWKDVNGDGDLWDDLNGDGVVNEDEIDAGEYIRFTYGYNRGTALQARVKQPLERMHDGIFISLRHRNASEDIPVTHMKFQVNFYEHSAWDWLTLSTGSVTAPAEGTATFDATVDVPANAPIGVYNGAIIAAQPDGADSVIPVVVNVAAAGADFHFGTALGAPPADTPYDNSSVSGYFDWSWRAESGDWRFFFTDLPDDTPDGTMLLVGTQWMNPETDIDTLVMGPTEDCYSNGAGCSSPFRGFPGDPDYYGPYTLDTLAGSSANNYVGSGVWRWDTNTGGPRELVAVDAQPGLHLIALHNVLFAGQDTSESFVGTVGTIRVAPRPISITTETDSGSVQVTVQSSLAFEDLAAEGWGLGTPETFADQVTNQDDPNDPTTASYTRTVTINHAALLDVTTGNSSGNDIDLYVLDPDGNLAGASTTSTANEQVAIQFPRDGEWTIAVHGWSVPTGTATFDLTINAVQGFDLTVTDLPEGPFAPDEEVTFTLNYDRAMNPGESWQGLLTIGPGMAPGVVKVPVTINRVAPPPPAGRYSLAARVFVDSRCDTFFSSGEDRAMVDAPVTVTFSNGATVTNNTLSTGLVLFTGYDMSDGVSVSVEMPAEYHGWTLGACRNSPTTLDLTASNFGPFRSKFVTFRAEVTGEAAGP